VINIDNPPICPICGQDLFRHYRADNVTRWRCLCSPVSYSEREYVVRPGEMPVRRRGGDGELQARTAAPAP
jgi:hypothetical protein